MDNNKNFSNNFDKYNLSVEETAFVDKVTKNYSRNIEVTEELIQKGLLEDFMNNDIGKGQKCTQMEIFMYLRGKADDFSKERFKNLKQSAQNYFIRIDDKCFKGISKIKANNISINSKIYISNDSLNYTFRSFKKRSQFDLTYQLNKEEKNWLEKDTCYYRKNLKLAKKVLDEGYYDEYCKYCHSQGIYDGGNYFKEQYKIMKKLLNAGSFSDDEIKRLSYKRRGKDIIQLDNKYYNNINKADDEILKNAKQHNYYDKIWYKNAKKVKQYKIYQQKNNINDRKMEKVWSDTKKLTKNKKLVQKALQNGSYDDYYKYRKRSDMHFKDNYRTYLQVKQSDLLTEKEKKIIINKYGEPCVSLNPTYWGNKAKKTKNTLKSKRVKSEDKYKVINKRISYRRPYADEWISDIKIRLMIGGLILSGIGIVGGLMAWAALNDSNVKLIKLKF